MSSSAVSPSAALASRSAGPLAGIGLMLFGIFLFSFNDAMGKWLLGTYSVGMVLLIRSAAALAVLAPFLWREGGFRRLFKVERPWLQLLRVVLGTGEVAFFYWAVVTLPLADVMTFYLAAPIYVVVLSIALLGEKVDLPRWIAIICGFIGVLIVLQPSSASLSLPAFVSVAGSLFFSLLMIVTRRLRGTPDSALLAFTMLGALVAGAVWAPLEWTTPTLQDGILLALLGVVALGAHFCVTRSLKLAPASIVVPYQYTLLIWAIVLGWLFFGDLPKPTMLIGAAIIVASGLVIFLIEQRAQRRSGGAVAE